MAKKRKVASIAQVAPKRRLMCPNVYPIIEDSDDSVKVSRPARSISQLIKRGLVNGISKDIGSTNGNSYDKFEGSCPKGLRLDVDKFDLATTMLRHGDDAKTLTKKLNE